MRRHSTSLSAGCSVLVVIVWLALWVAAPRAYGAAQTGGRVAGTVRDQAGAPVAGATATLRGRGVAATRTTNGSGEFAFDGVPEGPLELVVEAEGFGRLEREVDGPAADRLDLTLAPAPLSDEVTVTPSGTPMRVGETAASVSVLSRPDLDATAAPTLDDALRQVVGFSLFRRSGSRTANPTAQGVSLRGVGASGASRALVIADGIPLNDPFGGWVYWDRVPRESVRRIEVLRGGGSDVYGSSALGGVVNLITEGARDTGLTLETSYGNEKTADGSLSASARRGGWGAAVSAQAFHTDGYVLVDEDERGAVDTPAASEHTALTLTVERDVSEALRLFARGSLFGEDRRNGTPLQRNRTHVREIVAGGDWERPALGAFSVRAYASAQVFDQSFSAIAADRDSEALVRNQRVPAQAAGLTVRWSREAGSSHLLVAGIDASEVRGASDETIFFGGQPGSFTGSGGRERSFGVFGQDIARVGSRLILTVGGRVDRWRNFAALSTTRSVAQFDSPSVRVFPDRVETAFSPRVSALVRVTDWLSANVSGYRAFRAPTLNELYRSFRVGNILTLANDELRAERLTGGEAGATATALEGRFRARGTFFWSEITRPIANVTLAVAPELITRQRQNLGRTRSRGLELEAEARPAEHWSVAGGYQFTDAEVLRFPANVALEGLLLPQVPRHQLTFQARYANPSVVTVGVQGRASGAQFEDDQNRLSLGRYFALDARVSRRVARGVELFVAAENVFDARYAVGRTPVETLGQPALVRFGMTVSLGAR